MEWEGLGFRAEAGGNGLKEARRQTKGSRGFSEQGHQAKAQRNQSPPVKPSMASALQSSGAVCKQMWSTQPQKHPQPQNILLGFRT